MKDFAPLVELMKRALGLAVTVVPNGIIFVTYSYIQLHS